MDVPYTFEEYAYARAQSYLARAAPNSLRRACHALARIDAQRIFDFNEQHHIYAADINTREQEHNFEHTTQLPPKAPHSDVANQTAVDESSAAAAARERRLAADRLAMPPPPPRPSAVKAPVVAAAAAELVGSQQPARPSGLTVAAGVAAFSGRGQHVPVKQPTKRRRQEDDVDYSEALPVAKKQKELASEAVGAGQPASSPSQRPQPGEQKPAVSRHFFTSGKKVPSNDLHKFQVSADGTVADPVAVPRVAKRKLDDSADSGVEMPEQKKSRATMAQKQPRQQRLGAGKGVQIPIMNGDSLPANAHEARAVAQLRRQFLEDSVAARKEAEAKASRGVAKRKAKKPAGKKAAAQAAIDTSLMPEFFSITPGDDDAVRCVCGCTDSSDEKRMIACDSCNVWQHIECMGEAVPADPETDDYTCHQCDPWAHRKLIQTLRQESGIYR